MKSNKTIVNKIAPYKYEIPVYTVVDGTGIELVSNHMKDFDTSKLDKLYVQMVRGSRIDEENVTTKLDGVLIEQLLEVCILHLEDINKGDLKTVETTIAIEYINLAQEMLFLREDKRRKKGVLGTNQK